MEINELHRGRLVDHIQLVVKDLSAARTFYEAVLKVLNIPIGGEGEGFFWADEIVVSSADSPAALGMLTGRNHIAFQAQNRTMVDAFYKAALANGGADNGAPGERPYHPAYYAAFVLDPDGNNIEAVYHGEGERSAPFRIHQVLATRSHSDAPILQGGKAMSEIEGIARFKLHPGKLEEFKRLSAECMETVRTKDSGTLQYDLFFNADQTECIVHERYRNSEALLDHFQNLDKTMDAILATGSVSGEILGNPSPELRKALEGSGVRIFTLYQSL